MKNIIRLEERFRETPLLHELLVSGEVSMHKMERLTSIAEPRNEEFLANQVQLLSRPALDTLVRDQKRIEAKFLACQRSALPIIHEIVQVSVPLDPDVAEAMFKLKEKGINLNGELRIFLKQRTNEIEEEKNICTEKEQARARQRMEQHQEPSRYITVRTKNLLKKEHGIICSINGCNKPSIEIHHKQRFALANIHDPNYLAPLCKQHHEIAHAIDVKVQEKKRRR